MDVELLKKIYQDAINKANMGLPVGNSEQFSESPVVKAADTVSTYAPYNFTFRPVSKAVPFISDVVKNPVGMFKVGLDKMQATNPEELAYSAVMGTFGGAKAKDFAKAQAEGRTFGNIADKMERMEINDSLSKYIGRKTNLGQSPEGVLNDVLRHDELYKQYPKARNIEYSEHPMDHNVEGVFYPDMNTMHINSNMSDAKKHSSIIHEIQHYLQNYEGRSPGNNLTKYSDAKSVKNYINDSSEIEARDAASRINLTPEQRAYKATYSSQNIPIKDWIVKK